MADQKRVREGKGYYRQLDQASTGELLWGSSQKKKKRMKNTDPKIFPVERVVSRRIEVTKTQYLIKWAGYSAYENSWLDEDDLSDDLIRHVFEKSNDLTLFAPYS
ncbi:chromobox protein homolog 2-like [Actinia tenebrosa]|uniref:Chromobox protein homolog 2-like n=1 Tax=Actinia tenebrosa TaxID=6105 RepID=A0A6P8HDP6_ACTTE|nr:chromobox protein homolog 2-like [Actinia tenebrosa]